MFTFVYWMRLLRVQAQLRTANDNTNVIIKKINTAKNIQSFYLAVVVVTFSVGNILETTAIAKNDSSYFTFVIK